MQYTATFVLFYCWVHSVRDVRRSQRVEMGLFNIGILDHAQRGRKLGATKNVSPPKEPQEVGEMSKKGIETFAGVLTIMQQTRIELLGGDNQDKRLGGLLDVAKESIKQQFIYITLEPRPAHED